MCIIEWNCAFICLRFTVILIKFSLIFYEIFLKFICFMKKHIQKHLFLFIWRKFAILNKIRHFEKICQFEENSSIYISSIWRKFHRFEEKLNLQEIKINDFIKAIVENVLIWRIFNRGVKFNKNVCWQRFLNLLPI